MLASLDGKISTGKTDNLDIDKDLPNIVGVKEGLYQYYDIEQTTDLWSLNSGRVQAKIGVNTRDIPKKGPVSFVMIDNKNLNESGIKYFCALSDRFVLITTNKNHPAFNLNGDNMVIILQEELCLKKALCELYELGCERLTVQSGGTLNALFLKEGLIDFVDIVVAPILIGGKDTPTVIDGSGISEVGELGNLRALELIECKVLEGSYVRLRYKVINN
jgi:2,5-diamino-6-(ribosylamino)-4(3H)-pyrimidinone 5'-phosphate reductase